MSLKEFENFESPVRNLIQEVQERNAFLEEANRRTQEAIDNDVEYQRRVLRRRGGNIDEADFRS